MDKNLSGILGDWKIQAAAVLMPVVGTAVSITGTIFSIGVLAGIGMGIIDAQSALNGVSPLVTASNSWSTTSGFCDVFTNMVANRINLPVLPEVVRIGGGYVSFFGGLGSAIGDGTTNIVIANLPGVVKGIQNVLQNTFPAAGLVVTEPRRRLERPMEQLTSKILAYAR